MINSTTTRPHKSRNLSMLEFLDMLQVEYTVAKLRSQIYPQQKDRRYFEEVMDRKRAKIDNIAERNRLPNIFNDPTAKRDIDHLVFPAQGGMPNFHYKNDEQRAELEVKDYHFYFCVDQEVRIYWEDQTVKTGTIVSVSQAKNIAIVKLRNSATQTPVSCLHIARII